MAVSSCVFPNIHDLPEREEAPRFLGTLLGSGMRTDRSPAIQSVLFFPRSFSSMYPRVRGGLRRTPKFLISILMPPLHTEALRLKAQQLSPLPRTSEQSKFCVD